MTQAFNLSQLANFVNTSGQLSLTTGITGLLPIANGGTGTATPSIVGGTNITISGSWPNQTVAFSGSAGLTGFSTAIFSSPGSWTPPSGVTQARITVIGGGGAGGNTSGQGGGGGVAVAYCTNLSGSYSVTIGNGGGPASSNPGGTSSFSGTNASISATGGIGGTPGSGAPGSGTVSTGTAIRTTGIYSANNTAQMTGWGLGVGVWANTPNTSQTWSISSSGAAGMGGHAGAPGGNPGGGGYSGVVYIEY